MNNNPPMKDAIDQLTRATVNMCAKIGALDRLNLPEYLRAFKELSDHTDRVEELFKTIKQMREELSGKTLPEIFKENGVDSLKTGGRNFILNVRMFASIPQDKETKGFAWLKTHGYGPLIQQKVNSQSLSSAINGYFEAEAKLPPEDAISIHNKEYISIKKA